MADQQMTPEQALEMQKQNCIFCKIISGAMESKKVYEDDLMLAILDINPANKGHVLVMPKEHYPILPLVPPETFSHVFSRTQRLMEAMRTALIVPRVTLFIANGGAAGQKSPHFLFHLIPREENDGLDSLDLGARTTSQEGTLASFAPKVTDLLQRATGQATQPQPSALQAPSAPQAPLSPPVSVSQERGPAPAGSAPGAPQPAQPMPAPSAPMPAPPPASTLAPTPVPQSQRPARPQSPVQPPSAAPQSMTEEAKEHLAQVLQQNPGLADLIKQVPDQVEAYVRGSPELSVLFEKVDIRALSARLREQDGLPPVAPQASAVPTTASQSTDVPDAAVLDDQQLLAYLEQKPKLKEMLLEEPASLEGLKATNPRVAAFFRSVTPAAVAARIRALGLQPEGTDFDALARHLTK